MFRRSIVLLAAIFGLFHTARGEEPLVTYVFPAGGQRGTTVEFRVGGHYLFDGADFQMLGPGVTASPRVERTESIWFEGPVVPLPQSQQAENYPKDYAGSVSIAADAVPGPRHAQVSTSQGATAALKFIVGDLPEIVEREIDGDPIPVAVQLPVTINGRMFPREDVDLWTFAAQAGQTIHAEVMAARLGSPLDSFLEALDPQGQVIAEDFGTFGADSYVRFTAATDGEYTLRIRDANYDGLQHFVYRLTVSAAPRVESVFPLGGRRGTTTRFELSGANVPASPVEISLPADAARDHVQRFELGGLVSEPFLLETDDLDELLEAEPNDNPEQAAAVPVPGVANGRIGAPGDVDCWKFAATKDAAIEIDLRASRLGSPLDGVLTLLDGEGRELGRADDLADGQTDARLSFTAPADGAYFVRVEDRFSSRGGSRYAYRLRIAPAPAPDFRLTLAADGLTVLRGGEAKLRIDAERLGGCNEAISLSIEGLPEGVGAPADLSIAAGAANLEVVLKADATAPIRTSRLTIRGTARVGELTISRVAARPAPRGEVPLDSVLLAVAPPTPFKVKGEYIIEYQPRGGVYRRHYRIDRGGYEGPLTVSVSDRQMRHLQGVTGPTITVPAGVTEFDFPVQLPPWMEIGRTCRVVMMAVGEIVEADGSRHAVSFCSQNQNEQIVALVDPGPLGLQAEATSVRAVPGGEARVAIRAQRARHVSGPARIELIVPAHIAGVCADPVEIPADGESGILTVRFSPGAGPFNMPLTIRATASLHGDPVQAETRLTVVETD
jgi:hypothetical protein